MKWDWLHTKRLKQLSKRWFQIKNIKYSIQTHNPVINHDIIGKWKPKSLKIKCRNKIGWRYTPYQNLFWVVSVLKCIGGWQIFRINTTQKENFTWFYRKPLLRPGPTVAITISITIMTQRECIPLVEWACAYSAWSNSTNIMRFLCVVMVNVFVITAVGPGL